MIASPIQDTIPKAHMLMFHLRPSPVLPVPCQTYTCDPPASTMCDREGDNRIWDGMPPTVTFIYGDSTHVEEKHERARVDRTEAKSFEF